MDRMVEYFVDSVGLLDEHKWIYDFQMTELFSLPIMPHLFPPHVCNISIISTIFCWFNWYSLFKWIFSLRKCTYKQLYELVASNDFDQTYVRIKLWLFKFKTFWRMFCVFEERTSRAGCRIQSARKFKAVIFKSETPGASWAACRPHQSNKSCLYASE